MMQTDWKKELRGVSGFVLRRREGLRVEIHVSAEEFDL